LISSCTHAVITTKQALINNMNLVIFNFKITNGKITSLVCRDINGQKKYLFFQENCIK
jgi:hypothetical protein